MGYLRSLGVCPEYRGIRNADDDFAFATSAKVFVQGGGGYSRFMAKLVTKRGGRVLMPQKEKREAEEAREALAVARRDRDALKKKAS